LKRKEDKKTEKEFNEYLLPDGNQILISQALQEEVGELLFQPSKIGLEYPGVHELIQQSIQACDVDLRKHLFQNVILAGGTTTM
jgi:centractin